MRLSAIITALLLGVGVMTAVPAAAADADGDARPCVTTREWRSIHLGDTRPRVVRVFDTDGRGRLMGPGNPVSDDRVVYLMRRLYPQCGTWNGTRALLDVVWFEKTCHTDQYGCLGQAWYVTQKIREQ